MTVRSAVLMLAVVLTGLSAGFFFTYEASVTLGLAEVDDRTYVTTFQALNDTIRNPGFSLVFFGAIPVIAAALIVHWNLGSRVRGLIGAALACYLACLAITGAGNVPLNEELAAVESITPASAADARDDFETDWNQLNLIRTIAVVASFVMLVGATGRSRYSASAPTPLGVVPSQSSRGAQCQTQPL